MSGTLEEQVAELVEQLHGRGGASAQCDLTSLGAAAIPLVAAAYDRESSARRRASLVHVLWEFRDPAAFPTLAVALRDPDEEVWKEALDGIVALGGVVALDTLRTARADAVTFKDAETRREWIDEAIEQVTEADPG